ncbi:MULTISPECIES: hypothetical protein [unclassified Nocardia]|uniref:hypothetical protein n=1 Tax=unclassified Nocardia TaxID=2637762 RepID=UPI001074E923|nr:MULTISPECIES: hypothetical protein [unclassified Nocardia]QBS42007.1 hypothetical protein DMB37_19570 [Nocardia sp. CS682]
MSKIRVFGVVFAATAGIILAGSGLASAQTGGGGTAPETGSAAAITELAKLLATGSAGTDGK